VDIATKRRRKEARRARNINYKIVKHYADERPDTRPHYGPSGPWGCRLPGVHRRFARPLPARFRRVPASPPWGPGVGRAYRWKMDLRSLWGRCSRCSEADC
jgi:hypothetical protein